MARDDIYDLRPMLRGNAEVALVEGKEFDCAHPDAVLLGIVMPPEALQTENHPWEANVRLESREQLGSYMTALLTGGGVARGWARGYRKGWRIAAAKWSSLRDAIVIVVEAIP